MVGKSSNFILVIIVAFVAFANTQRPTIPEDFTANVTSSVINGSVRVVAKGHMYISYSTQKRRIDLDLDSGSQVQIERYDQNPKERYIIANSTCQREKTEEKIIPMWEWLHNATAGGSCTLDTRKGEQWTGADNGIFHIACIQNGNTPLELTSSGKGETDVLTFSAFIPGRPYDALFNVPPVCGA